MDRAKADTITSKDSGGDHKNSDSVDETSSNAKITSAKGSDQERSVIGWESLVMFLTIARCGPICIGTMTSVSSLLGLIGAPLVGALSDKHGRRIALAIGCVTGAISFTVFAATDSLLGLWLALIPPALLSHNSTITKAVVADLSTPGQRAGILGKLGLAAGMGFMVGPFINPFISGYVQASIVAIILQCMSLIAIYCLPSREASVAKSGDAAKVYGSASIIFKVLRALGDAVQKVCEIAIAAPAAARVMLFLRFGYSMGFHVFFIVMNVTLTKKFKYGPNEFSNHFAFVGLVSSVSQLLSKNLINRRPADSTSVVIICTFFLMTGRLMTALTASPYVLYFSLTLSISALGILDNTINTAVAQISGRESVGGLMGVLDTAEKLAGVCGPTVGGVLYAYDALAPVAAVTGGYLAMMAVVYVAYPRYVVPAVAHALVLPAPAAPAPPADKKNE